MEMKPSKILSSKTASFLFVSPVSRLVPRTQSVLRKRLLKERVNAYTRRREHNQKEQILSQGINERKN